MSDKLKWGVVALGSISHKVVKSIQRAGNEVIACGSRDLAKSKDFAAKHNIPRAYGSYQEVFDDKDVEAVYIASPTSLHHELTLKCAKAKKHVLCEKPLAKTAKEVEEMLQACKENNVQFLDGTMWVHHKRTQDIERTFSELGGVYSVNSRFTWASEDVTNIRWNPETEPLGSLGDMGWYNLRFILFAFDELPTRVLGATTRLGPAGNIVDFSGILWFSNDRSARFDCSFAIPTIQSGEICGKKKNLYVNDFVLPWKGSINFTPDNEWNDVAEFIVEEYPFKRTVHKSEPCIQEVEMIKDLVLMAKGKKDGSKWAKHALWTHKIIDALLASAEKGQVVSLN